MSTTETKPIRKAPMRETGAETTSSSTATTLRDYLELFRPTQWVKNVVVLAAPAAALKLASPGALGQTLTAFAAFCLAASATYAINDVFDREADARHPTKRRRPVARGAIKPGTAIVMAVLLVILAGVLSGFVLGPRFMAVLAVYLFLTFAYSYTLKDRVILDVMVVATGFVLRAWGGALAVGVPASEWLVACVFTLCLFMGFGKRRCELAMINDVEAAGQHRATLLRYTPDLLNHLITVSAGIAIITFLLYTMDTGAHPAPFQKGHLFYTLPVVVYGIFRFAMLTETGRYVGPTEIVLKDRPLLGSIIAWAALALAIAYEEMLFGPKGIVGLFGGA